MLELSLVVFEEFESFEHFVCLEFDEGFIDFFFESLPDFSVVLNGQGCELVNDLLTPHLQAGEHVRLVVPLPCCCHLSRDLSRRYLHECIVELSPCELSEHRTGLGILVDDTLHLWSKVGQSKLQIGLRKQSEQQIFRLTRIHIWKQRIKLLGQF